MTGPVSVTVDVNAPLAVSAVAPGPVAVTLSATATLPSSVVSVGSTGGGQAIEPTVLLDTYYDSSAYANKSAAINAATAAAQALRGTLEFRHGRVYSLDATFVQIAPALPLKIKGNGATLKSTWGSQHMVDFTRTADYQTWADISCDDLIFDANNQVSGSSESVVGNLSAGVWSQRGNFERIRFSNCKWLNVPVGGGSTVTECFALAGKHNASGETQTHLTNIRVEKAYMRGGDVGAVVMGTGVSGATNAGVEVYHDQVYIEVDHDTGVVPVLASAAGANVQIGSVGWGDYCEVKVHGANSGDVGVEIDGMQTAICTGTIIDSKDTAFFCRNFHPPRSVTSQKNTFRECVAITRNVDKGSIAGAGARDFSPGGDSTANFAFGEVVFDNCQSQIETALASWTGSTAMCIDVSNVYVRRVKIINHRIGCHAMATNAGTNPIFNNFWTADPRGVIDIDGIDTTWAGTIGISSAAIYEIARFSTVGSTITKVNAKGITLDFSGISTANLTSVSIYLTHWGVNAGSTFTGSIARLKMINGAVGGMSALDLVHLNTNFHVAATGHFMPIDECDSAGITTSVAQDYRVANSTQHGFIRVRSIAGRRNNTGSPFVVPTAITPGASPYAYQNQDYIPEDVIVSGGTVSDISYSTDNTTYFTTGQTTGKFRVEPGHYLKVTYSVVPTMTKIPS